VHEDISRVIERSSVASADQIRQQVAELAEVVQTTGSNLGFHIKSIADDATGNLERVSVDTSQLLEQSRSLVIQGMQSVASDYIERVAQSRAELITDLDQSAAGVAAAVDEATGQRRRAASTRQARSSCTGLDQTLGRAPRGAGLA